MVLLSTSVWDLGTSPLQSHTVEVVRLLPIDVIVCVEDGKELLQDPYVYVVVVFSGSTVVCSRPPVYVLVVGAYVDPEIHRFTDVGSPAVLHMYVVLARVAPKPSIVTSD